MARPGTPQPTASRPMSSRVSSSRSLGHHHHSASMPSNNAPGIIHLPKGHIQQHNSSSASKSSSPAPRSRSGHHQRKQQAAQQQQQPNDSSKSGSESPCKESGHNKRERRRRRSISGIITTGVTSPVIVDEHSSSSATATPNKPSPPPSPTKTSGRKARTRNRSHKDKHQQNPASVVVDKDLASTTAILSQPESEGSLSTSPPSPSLLSRSAPSASYMLAEKALATRSKFSDWEMPSVASHGRRPQDLTWQQQGATGDTSRRHPSSSPASADVYNSNYTAYPSSDGQEQQNPSGLTWQQILFQSHGSSPLPSPSHSRQSPVKQRNNNNNNNNNRRPKSAYAEFDSNGARPRGDVTPPNVADLSLNEPFPMDDFPPSSSGYSSPARQSSHHQPSVSPMKQRPRNAPVQQQQAPQQPQGVTPFAYPHPQDGLGLSASPSSGSSMYNRYAGPNFHNSPQPSALPAPTFLRARAAAAAAVGGGSGSGSGGEGPAGTAIVA